MDQTAARLKTIAKGAEADLYLLENWRGIDVLLKKRTVKKYRIPELDRAIREYRTIHEAEIMHNAKKLGVSTPAIYLVDLSSSTIYMEHVKGQLIRGILDKAQKAERLSIFLRIGVEVGKLHKNAIIHGDLTTSNMILTPQNRICFLDFGLAEQSEETEKRGVDIHLMKHMLLSTHYSYAEECLSSFLNGYSEAMGSQVTREVMRKVEEIERRGRYVSEREIPEDDNEQQEQVP